MNRVVSVTRTGPRDKIAVYPFGERLDLGAQTLALVCNASYRLSFRSYRVSRISYVHKLCIADRLRELTSP